MKAPRETDLVRSCLNLLHAVGVFAWRNNTGAVVLRDGQKRRFFRAGLVGSSDIIGVLPGSGRMLAVECKQPGGRVTAGQRAFLDLVAAAGGAALVVSDLRQLEEFLRGEGLLR
jgi:hypothetical protein